MPDYVQSGLSKSIKRYRDGDISGSITAICGVLDSITEKVYKNNSLGDHKNTAYHERIAKSYGVYEDDFTDTLNKGGFDEDEADIVWKNQKKSVGQSAYVLGSYRRNISDVHGDQEVDQSLVQHVLDNAIYIIRSLCAYLD